MRLLPLLLAACADPNPAPPATPPTAPTAAASDDTLAAIVPTAPLAPQTYELTLPDGNLLFTEEMNRRIYRVSYDAE